MNKVILIGYICTYGCNRTPVFCNIKYENKRLSITGVEGPKRNGDAWGSCGQIEMHYKTLQERTAITPAGGWTPELIGQFFDVWDRWHLNDMRAGSQVQMEYLRANPVKHEDYTKRCERLAAAGLNPDLDGYKYGHAWKFEEVPASVIEFLKSLPDSLETPAWV